MKHLQLNFDKGWTEVILNEDCGFDKFYLAAGILEKELNIVFINKLDDFDCLYWDFEIDNRLLTLHYHVYFGLSLFPTKFKEASEADNSKVLEIGQILFGKLK